MNHNPKEGKQQKQRDMTVRQMHEYISSKGINLNDKVLSEPHLNVSHIWQTFLCLSKLVQCPYIKQTLAVTAHQIQDSEKHRKSMPFMAELITISETLKNIKLEFKILSFFKPDRERVLPHLSALCRLSQNNDRIRMAYDTIFVAYDQSKRELEKSKHDDFQIKTQLDLTKKKKYDDQEIYMEKMQNYQKCRNNSIEEKKKKSELDKYQKIKQDQLYRKKKEVDQLEFAVEENQFQINKLKKEIANNAHESKKEKRIAEEQYFNITTSHDKNMSTINGKISQSQDILAKINCEEYHRANDFIKEKVKKNKEYQRANHTLFENLKGIDISNIHILERASFIESQLAERERQNKMFFEEIKNKENQKLEVERKRNENEGNHKMLKDSVQAVQSVKVMRKTILEEHEQKINQKTIQYHQYLSSLEKELEEWGNACKNSLNKIYEPFAI